MWSRLVVCGFLIFGLILLGACGARKRKISPVTENGGAVSIGDFKVNNLDFHSFSGRAKARLEMGDDKRDVTLHIRIQRDKAIWISVTALLGIEAVRVLITPDSVKILNKLQGEYIAKPFSYIYRYTNQGITFSTLQDILMANVSTGLLRTDNLTLAAGADETQLVGIKDDLSFQYSLNEDVRTKALRLTRLGSGGSLEALYGNFEKTDGYNFPRNQNINLKAERVEVNTVLEYNRVVFNESVDVPFTVPLQYKVVD